MIPENITNKLKPCPFCGRKVFIEEAEVTGKGVLKLILSCPACNVLFNIGPIVEYYNLHYFKPDMMDAVNIWNRRETEMNDE